jgi:hypothetical protein
VNCQDWGSGQAVGGLAAYTLGTRGANSARIVGVSAVPLAALADLVAGHEYFSFQLTINNQKTVGTGACGGCEVSGCIALKSIKLTTPNAANDVTLSYDTAADSTSALAAWQGGAGVATSTEADTTRCPAATPKQNKTMNGVRALYR